MMKDDLLGLGKIHSCLFILAALAFLSSISSVDARSDSYAEAGKWSITAYFQEDSGGFLRCAASTRERNNSKRSMSVAINWDSELEIWFGDEDWQLQQDASYELDYQIDRFERRSGTFHTVTEKAGFFEAGHAEDTFAEMRRGHVLYVLTSRTRMEFSLKGSARAMALMRECWNRHLDEVEEATNPFGSPDAANSQNPFEARATAPARKNGSERKDSARSADHKGKARSDARKTSIMLAKYVTSRLSDEGFKAYETVPAAFVELNLDMVWEAPGVWGMTKQASSDIDAEVLAAGLLLKTEDNCVGEFASDSYERDFFRRGTVTVVKVACSDNGEGDTYFGVYSFYPMRSETVLVAHVGLEPGPTVDADESFFNTLGELLNK